MRGLTDLTQSLLSNKDPFFTLDDSMWREVEGGEGPGVRVEDSHQHSHHQQQQQPANQQGLF